MATTTEQTRFGLSSWIAPGAPFDHRENPGGVAIGFTIAWPPPLATFLVGPERVARVGRALIAAAAALGVLGAGSGDPSLRSLPGTPRRSTCAS